ncbi:MAG: hypothetical protein KF832_16100 [Caldilineaceae bacterium]|nr:hypothetical protein [Caldilineaceae bacterium]
MLAFLRTKILYTTALSLLLFLGACSPGAVQVPDRPVEITLEEGLAAQDLLLAGLATGEVQLTEAQFSSLLTKLLEANTGSNQPVEAITAWFEPGQLYLRLTLKEDVLASNFGRNFDLVGALTVEDGVLQIALDEAAAGNLVAPGALLQPIADQINAALAQQVAGLPLNVTVDEGTLTLGLAQ